MKNVKKPRMMEQMQRHIERLREIQLRAIRTVEEILERKLRAEIEAKSATKLPPLRKPENHKPN